MQPSTVSTVCTVPRAARIPHTKHKTWQVLAMASPYWHPQIPPVCPTFPGVLLLLDFFSTSLCAVLFLALHPASAASAASASSSSSVAFSQLISHNSSHTTQLTQLNSRTTQLTQFMSYNSHYTLSCHTNSSHPTQLTPLHSHNLPLSRGRRGIRMASAAFDVSGAAFAWQVQHFDCLATAGTCLVAAQAPVLSPGTRSVWCSSSTFAWQVQHFDSC